MTIDINGDVIDEITIDGQNVSEVTIDGDTVFSIPPVVAPSNLVARYTFDNSNLNDSASGPQFATTNSYDGFNATDISFDQSFAQDGTTACKINNQTRDGSNSSARFFIDKDVLYNRGSFTASLWVYETLDSSNRIINFGNTSANEGGMIIGTRSGSPIKTRIYTDEGNGNWNDIQVNNLSYNNWHMITQVYDGSTNKAYVDGNLLGTETRGYDDTPSNPGISIGNKLDDTTEAFGGYINDLRFYNTGLSDSEVQEIYDNTKP